MQPAAWQLHPAHGIFPETLLLPLHARELHKELQNSKNRQNHPMKGERSSPTPWQRRRKLPPFSITSIGGQYIQTHTHTPVFEGFFCFLGQSSQRETPDTIRAGSNLVMLCLREALRAKTPINEGRTGAENKSARTPGRGGHNKQSLVGIQVRFSS